VTRIIASFSSPAGLREAIDRTRAAGWRVITVCSPAFDEALLQQIGATHSPVAARAGIGGVLGIVCGFLLTIGTVRQWPRLIVSGKPLVAMPSFLIIVFELAILLASVAAFASFLISSRRSRREAQGACDATTTDARFALLIESPAASSIGPAGGIPRREIDTLLRRSGAVECRSV
jgi:ActD protein